MINIAKKIEIFASSIKRGQQFMLNGSDTVYVAAFDANLIEQETVRLAANRVSFPSAIHILDADADFKVLLVG